MAIFGHQTGGKTNSGFVLIAVIRFSRPLRIAKGRTSARQGHPGFNLLTSRQWPEFKHARVQFFRHLLMTPQSFHQTQMTFTEQVLQQAQTKTFQRSESLRGADSL